MKYRAKQHHPIEHPASAMVLVAAMVSSFIPGAVVGARPAGAQVVPEPAPIEAGVRADAGRYDTGVDVLHYDVHIALSDLSPEIVAAATLQFATTRDGVESLTLDFTGLAVDSVRIDGRATEDVTARNGLLDIGLGAPLEAGEQRRAEIFYRGTPDDGLIIRENVAGDPSAFVDNWPNRTRFWIPAVDHPSDKATIAYTVHAPEEWSVVANGRRVGDPYPTPADIPGPATSGARRTWRYTTRVPHPTYTMVVGAADMVVTEVGASACGRAPASARPDGCIETTTWLYPGSVEAGSPSFVRSADMLDFFAEMIGPFPYEKLAHVQSATRFGGMENSSAIFYSEEALAEGRDIEGTVSHEIAHQWFGDSVTQSDWAHLWLSEGFATYFGALYFEWADGRDRFRELMRGHRDRYFSTADSLRPMVDRNQTDLFELLNRNSYQKGAWVLHMLRSELGDRDFFDGIRLYYERFRDSNALSADLRVVMEEVSGRDLTVFFDQWLDHPGHPVVAVRTPSEGDDLVVELDQIQGDYAPGYDLAVPVRATWSGGTRTEIVRLYGDEAAVTFRGVPPDARVEIDPDDTLLARVVWVAP